MRKLQTTEGRTRRGSVLTVLVLAVILLGLIVAAVTVRDHRPRSNRWTSTLSSISVIEVAIRIYKVRTGSLPDTLDQLVHPVGEWRALLYKRGLIDAWGNPFAYIKTAETFEIRSSGPDGKMQTADDLVNH